MDWLGLEALTIECDRLSTAMSDLVPADEWVDVVPD